MLTTNITLYCYVWVPNLLHMFTLRLKVINMVETMKMRFKAKGWRFTSRCYILFLAVGIVYLQVQLGWTFVFLSCRFHCSNKSVTDYIVKQNVRLFSNPGQTSLGHLTRFLARIVVRNDNVRSGKGTLLLKECDKKILVIFKSRFSYCC